MQLFGSRCGIGLAINPTVAAPGSAVRDTITVTNTTAPLSLAISSVTVAIPAGAGTPTSITVVAMDPGGILRSWDVDSSPPPGFMRFSRSSASANDIDPTGTVDINFTATATTAGSKEWTTTAFVNNNYTQPFNLQGAQPTVTVCCISPIISYEMQRTIKQVYPKPVTQPFLFTVINE